MNTRMIALALLVMGASVSSVVTAACKNGRCTPKTQSKNTPKRK